MVDLTKTNNSSSNIREWFYLQIMYQIEDELQQREYWIVEVEVHAKEDKQKINRKIFSK